MSEKEGSCEPRPSQNAFVLQVIAAFKQSSPEMKVRDLEQPSHGSLKREEHKTFNKPVCTQEKAQVVLMCKALRNEELRPASSSDVDLSSISSSSLMQRRRTNRSLT